MEALRLPNVGDRFLDTWTIEGEVGHGGFSVVFRAHDDEGRVAAVKVLTPDGEGAAQRPSYDVDLADRFLREARLLEQLDSAYTIRLWDYGESPDGMLYMVFEFIDGRMLFDEIKQHGALPTDRVIHVLRQTLIALESAHALGILHRDIKPNNIMIYERDGDPDRVKLVDFGIAKMYGEDEDMPGNDLTAAGLLVGTPRYMAPEQLKGMDLGPPADLYSLGLCAIEMLSGRKCIPGKDRVKIVERQLGPEQVMIPDDVEVDMRLAAIVHRLTQKRVPDRYASATEALRDLEALAGDPGTTGDTVYETVPADFGSGLNQAAGDDDTVFETVNSAELAALIDKQRAQAAANAHGPVDPYDVTLAAADLASAGPDDRTVASSISNSALAYAAGGQQPPIGEASTKPFERPDPSLASDEFNQMMVDRSYGSGNFVRPPVDQSYGSGQFQQPPVDQSYGSGQFQQPPGPYGQPQPPGGAYGSGQFQQAPPGGAYGSGQFQQPPVDPRYGSGQFQQPPVDPRYGSGQFQQAPPGGAYGSGQFQQPPVDPRYGSGPHPHGAPPQPGQHPAPYPQGPPQRLSQTELTADDKIALAASFVVPGVGQIVAGQVVKGAGVMVVLLASMLFTYGLTWLILMPLSLIDTFLLVRASHRRDVGPYEFFPDFRDLLN